MQIRPETHRPRAAGLRVAIAGAALVIVGAACATNSASTPAAGAPTATPAPAASPTAAASASSAASPTAAPATNAASASNASSPVRFAVVAEATQARYRATEQLVGRNLPSDAIGTTKNVTGAIVLDQSGAVVPGQSKITVDLTSLQSDSRQRDNFIQRSTLQTAQFPTAQFVPTKVDGLAQPLPTSGQVRFKLTGDLTVRGVTKPVTWDVTAQATPGDVSGTAATTVTFQDFGMTPPKAGPVLGVQNDLGLEIDFRATRAA
jgi:polyisoprenoid-binding protein YceI